MGKMLGDVVMMLVGVALFALMSEEGVGPQLVVLLGIVGWSACFGIDYERWARGKGLRQ